MSIYVSPTVRTKYQEGAGTKKLTISFPSLNLTLDNSSIYENSMQLKESVFEGDSIEFVGCICSNFSIELHGVNAQLKGQRIIVTIDTDNDNEPIYLFRGYVDSVQTKLESSYKKITCYDDLYYKASGVDVASWYNALHFPITIKQFRDSLFTRLGITQETTVLINDDVVIQKQYVPVVMNAIDVIKNICQFNGIFGLMDRSTGLFDYRFMGEAVHALYPSSLTFPGSNVFPSSEIPGSDEVNVSYYENVAFEDFYTNTITKVIIRDDDRTEGVSYGTGSNAYVVQGNIFAYGLDDAVLLEAAQGIYQKIGGFAYQPFDADMLGMPFIEVGDVIKVNVIDYRQGQGQTSLKSFLVLNRTLKGIQFLKDSYEVRGEQDQSIFVTDIGQSLEVPEQQLDDRFDEVDESISSLDERVTALEEGGTGFQVQSVSQVPVNPQDNTIYLIQGEIVTIQ